MTHSKDTSNDLGNTVASESSQLPLLSDTPQWDASDIPADFQWWSDLSSEEVLSDSHGVKVVRLHVTRGPRANRAIIELCCGPDSRIGRSTSASKGCDVYRITAEDDFTCSECVEKVTALLCIGAACVSEWKCDRPH